MPPASTQGSRWWPTTRQGPPGGVVAGAGEAKGRLVLMALAQDPAAAGELPIAAGKLRLTALTSSAAPAAALG